MTAIPTADLASTIHDAIRRGDDLCVVDMESILIDAQAWVLSSDSEVAGRLRTAFGAPEPEVGA